MYNRLFISPFALHEIKVHSKINLSVYCLFSAGQLLKNITPPRNAVSSTSHNVPNISHNVPSISQNVPCVPHVSQIKKETPIASMQQTEHLGKH